MGVVVPEDTVVAFVARVAQPLVVALEDKVVVVAEALVVCQASVELPLAVALEEDKAAVVVDVVAVVVDGVEVEVEVMVVAVVVAWEVASFVAVEVCLAERELLDLLLVVDRRAPDLRFRMEASVVALHASSYPQGSSNDCHKFAP